MSEKIQECDECLKWMKKNQEVIYLEDSCNKNDTFCSKECLIKHIKSTVKYKKAKLINCGHIRFNKEDKDFYLFDEVKND